MSLSRRRSSTAGARHSSYLFDGPNVVLVLDFDSSRLGDRDLDVSIAVMSFCRGRDQINRDRVPIAMKRLRRYVSATESVAAGATDWYRVLVLTAAWFAKRAFRNESEFQCRVAAAAALTSSARTIADGL